MSFFTAALEKNLFVKQYCDQSFHGFLELINTQDFKENAKSTGGMNVVVGWMVNTQVYKNCIFTVAFHEKQSAFLILSLKLPGAKTITILNRNVHVLDGFFSRWLSEAVES